MFYPLICNSSFSFNFFVLFSITLLIKSILDYVRKPNPLPNAIFLLTLFKLILVLILLLILGLQLLVLLILLLINFTLFTTLDCTPTPCCWLPILNSDYGIFILLLLVLFRIYYGILSNLLFIGKLKLFSY